MKYHLNNNKYLKVILFLYMNKNIKYIVEDLFDDFYDNKPNIIDDFLRQGYKYFPESKDALIWVIEKHYENNNYNLNDIDVSGIDDFSFLFSSDEHTGYKDFDVSQWDVSNGTDFTEMFAGCYEFNCDLSQWVVSSGKTFASMFEYCSNFTSDLSDWDVSNGENFSYMFYGCKKFNCNLSKWNVRIGADFKAIKAMFYECPINKNDKYKPTMLRQLFKYKKN